MFKEPNSRHCTVLLPRMELEFGNLTEHLYRIKMLSKSCRYLIPNTAISREVLGSGTMGTFRKL